MDNVDDDDGDGNDDGDDDDDEDDDDDATAATSWASSPVVRSKKRPSLHGPIHGVLIGI